MCGVSTMTIRRDVDALASQGSVLKTLGGVQKAKAPFNLYETSLGSRLAIHIPEKRAIAAKAIELLDPNKTIYLDGSSTCLEFAKQIAQKIEGLTIITNSALACIELGQSPRNTVVGVGGQYDHDSSSFVGPSSEDLIKRYYVDMAFFSTKGLIVDEGTFESSVATFRLKEIMANQSGRVVLLADHSKFGQRALCKVLDMEQIDTIITDDQTSRADLDRLEHAGIELHTAITRDLMPRLQPTSD